MDMRFTGNPINDWINFYFDFAFGNSPESKRFRYETAGLPFIGDLNRWYDSRQQTLDYMKNKSIDWNDVKYPSLLGNGGAGAIYNIGTKAFDSSTSSVEELYRDSERTYLNNLREKHLRTAIDANNMRRAWYYSRM